MNWKHGEDVIIAGSVSDEEAKKTIRRAGRRRSPISASCRSRRADQPSQSSREPATDHAQGSRGNRAALCFMATASMRDEQCRYCAPPSASQASCLVHSCTRPHAEHTVVAFTVGSCSTSSISMPVETSRPVGRTLDHDDAHDSLLVFDCAHSTEERVVTVTARSTVRGLRRMGDLRKRLTLVTRKRVASRAVRTPAPFRKEMRPKRDARLNEMPINGAKTKTKFCRCR